MSQPENQVGGQPPAEKPKPEPNAQKPSAKIPIDEGETLTASVSPTALPKAAQPSSASGSLSLNDVLAGRFKIVRFTGQGGMGEVYEAEDLELGERVALKTIRPEIAKDEQAIGRFKREIHLARKVTHPNVCRIFDMFHHRPASPDLASREGEITFLTMELLAGETLAERIRRQGRMTTTEALPLVCQMTEALTAAHKAGVIHRDFKSANVVLVPSQQEAEQLRTVVTDFGLARTIAVGGSRGASVLRTVGMVGTPAYMAPEQVRGLEITPAADIYAFGVVLYEMVTGTLPFPGDTPLSTAVRRLEEAPPSPRKYVSDLDVKWEAVILRCLERDPAERFASAADVVKALAGEQGVEGRPSRRRLRRLAFAAVAAFLLFTLSTGYYLRIASKPAEPASRSTPVVSAAPVKLRRSIAVLGFKNLSGRSDAAWLSTALSEMLGTELAAGEKLRIIPGENVARTKIELALSDADSLAKDTLARIQKNLGTDLVVLGSYIVLAGEVGGQIRLDLRLQDATAGETIAAVAETGTEARLFELVSRAGARLREKLGVGELSAVEASAVRAALPSSPEAARLYSEGLAKLRSFNILSARDLLGRAVDGDPQHALARSALAAAWSALGYDSKAREEARRAFELSAGLPREERLLVEGRYWEGIREWNKAVETYRTLFHLYPDNPDYGLRLCSAQTSAGKAKDALGTLEALRKLPPPKSDDPRIDLEEASATYALSDFKRQLAAATRAAEKGAAIGAHLLVARARLLQARALWETGDPKKSLAVSEEARRIYETTGDRWGLGTYLTNTANVLASQKDLAGATRVQEQALAIYREIGNKRGMASALNNIAINLKNAGSLERSKALQMESLAIRREIGDKSGVAVSLNNLATVFLDRGDLDAARKMYEESLAICREIGEERGAVRALLNLAIVLKDQGDLGQALSMLQESLGARRRLGDKRGLAITMFNVALVHGLRGDLPAAKRMYEESLAIDREIGDQRGIGYALFGLGELTMMEGNLTGARKYFEETLAIRERRGEKPTASETRLSMADLAVEERRHRDAESLARSAIAHFRREKADFAAAQGHIAIAKSFLARGKPRDAQKEVNRASFLLKTNKNLYVRLSYQIIAARVRGVLGKSPAAVKDLEAIIAETSKMGLRHYEFQARLAAGEVETASGNAAVGRARLATLESEAMARGFGLIARKAAVLRR